MERTNSIAEQRDAQAGLCTQILREDRASQLLEYASVVKLVRERNFTAAVLALRQWHILSRRIYGTLGFGAGIAAGMFLKTLLG